MVPNGAQSDLEPVKLRNQVEVDPAKDDFFRAVIEQRKALPNLKSISAEAKERLDLFLKILANAGSYGIYTRLDRIDLPEKDAEILTVYGLDGTFSAPTNVVERPGESYFPPLAAQITAGARLMLALLERLVAAAGGSYVFCDTDSMAITLPLEEVKQIAKRFVSLVPYNRSIVPGSILKIEDENLDPETGRPLQLFCHAIAWG